MTIPDRAAKVLQQIDAALAKLAKCGDALDTTE